MKTKKDILNATNMFLVQSLFGSMEYGPIVAAIDKAYIDMQTHTVSGNQENLFTNRKIVTEILYGRIQELVRGELIFDTWHEDVSRTIKESVPEFSYGQIQKWINMTIKYLFVLRQLGIPDVDDYFNESNAEHFHAPLDSYVLKVIHGKDIIWSKDITEYDQYLKLVRKVSFLEEYENWPEYLLCVNTKKDGKPRAADKGTYKRYIQDNPYKFSVEK